MLGAPIRLGMPRRISTCTVRKTMRLGSSALRDPIDDLAFELLAGLQDCQPLVWLCIHTVYRIAHVAHWLNGEEVPPFRNEVDNVAQRPICRQGQTVAE